MREGPEYSGTPRIRPSVRDDARKNIAQPGQTGPFGRQTTVGLLPAKRPPLQKTIATAPFCRVHNLARTTCAAMGKRGIMGYLDHIIACNRHDLGRYVPFVVDGARLGWVRRDRAPDLARLPHVFQVSPDRVVLSPDLISPDQRTQAIEQAAITLAEQGLAPRPRGEHFKVAHNFSGPTLFTVDRNVVTLLGLPAYGIHVNGMVSTADGPCLWIARRAQDRPVAPGKLDNMIAGGQPAHLTLAQNLAKEAAEEAGLSQALAATARPVGAISYCLEDGWGIKPDTMFCFDLSLPADFRPRNTDGEIQDFCLMPVAQVARLVQKGDDFKFNVNLVLIDFLIRHGHITPDTEPHYLALISGLNNRLG